MKTKYTHKSYLIALLFACTILICAGCGSGSSSDSSSKLGFMDSSEEEYSTGGEETAENQTEASDEVSEDKKTDEQGIDDTAQEEPSAQIHTEMLVYTCDLNIDTLDFEKSVAEFKTMLKNVNGFVEHETYSDGYSTSSYYVEEEDKEKTYETTVRVPSSQYEAFLGGADKLGDVRSKTSNVENVSQEYTDLNTSLEIYEAKEKRYIKQLSQITDDAQALKLEKELTELQVKIAQIKTRMNEIKTDVSYSTINVTLHEVAKYDEKPVKKDTFWQRLTNTVKDTWKTFLVFLEALLFFIIRVMPYAVLIALIILAVYYIQKKVYRKKDRYQRPGASEKALPEADLPESDPQESDEENPDAEMLQFTDESEPENTEKESE